MSSKSELLKRQLAHCKAELKSLKAGHQADKHGSMRECGPKGDGGNNSPIPISGRNQFFERPGIIGAAGTATGLLAGIIQLYSHSLAIWLLCAALTCLGLLIRFEIKDHGITAKWHNSAFLVVFVAAISLCGWLQWSEVVKSRHKEPSMTDLGHGLDDLKFMVSNLVVASPYTQAYFSNEWQKAQQQNSESQIALDKIKRATQPRVITAEQREKFIKILLDSNNVSKIPIKVVVASDETEAKDFGIQIREMLNMAGYWIQPSVLQRPINEELKKAGTNELFTSSILPDIMVPPFQDAGVLNEIEIRPDIKLAQTGYVDVENEAEIFAVFPVNRPTRNMLPSVMPMYPTKGFTSPPLHVYCGNPDPNSILLGVSEILMEVGIHVVPITGHGMLKSDEIAFLIPSKKY